MSRPKTTWKSCARSCGGSCSHPEISFCRRRLWLARWFRHTEPVSVRAIRRLFAVRADGRWNYLAHRVEYRKQSGYEGLFSCILEVTQPLSEVRPCCENLDCTRVRERLEKAMSWDSL